MSLQIAKKTDGVQAAFGTSFQLRQSSNHKAETCPSYVWNDCQLARLHRSQLTPKMAGIANEEPRFEYYLFRSRTSEG